MDPNQRNQLEQLLFGLHLWDEPGKRKVFLKRLLLGHAMWIDVQYDGSQREAAVSLLEQCDRHAALLLHGKPPVCALLDALRAEYGPEPDAIQRIDALAKLLCTAGAGPPRAAWKGAPYRGLAYYDRRHAPIFFGRESEHQGLLDALATEQGQRFLVVIGASGAGKSSLVRAGTWAALQRGEAPQIPGSRDWLIAAMTPTDLGAPMAGLHAATLAAVKEHDGYEDLLDFAWESAFAEIARGDSSLAALAERLFAHRAGCRWLLILDQMEELFTSVDPARREDFLDQLIDATKPPVGGGTPRLQVLATLRADFFHQCVGHPSLRQVIERGGKFLLGPPDRLALERMISGPLTAVDLLEQDEHGNWAPAQWTLDRLLAPRMASAATEQDGGLALMAFALRELYDRCRHRRHLDLDVYQSEAFGALSGAIARRADATLEALGEEGASAFPRAFGRLVRVSGKTGDEIATRLRSRKADWDGDPPARRLRDALIKARLLVTRGTERGPPTVEVAHEALLREWPRLVAWMKDCGEALRLRDKLKDDCQTWVREGRPVVRLWKHELLEWARRLLTEADLLRGLQVDDDMAEFLAPEADWLLAELLCTATDDGRREAIGMRLHEIGDPRPGVGVIDGVPDILWCAIPVAVGASVEIGGHGYFPVEPFYMAAYPVSYAQYQAFLTAEDGFYNDDWWFGVQKAPAPGNQLRRFVGNPADYVSWYDATAFCRWLSARLGFAVRLPDEWEWQWVAQGADARRVYPWGDKWELGLANTAGSGLGRTISVGMYPDGRSVDGVYDLAGNVSEWCRNKFESPGDTSADDSNADRVLRGGCWGFLENFTRAEARDHNRPNSQTSFYGFRVVCASPIR